MKRKSLILITFALFLATVGGLCVYRAILSLRPLVISVNECPTIGNEKAQIEVIVFEDFLCHTCHYFSVEVFPAIQSTYIDRGLVKYVMVPLAFSSHSREVASAALAVFHQTPGQYFLYVQELFLKYSDTKKLELKDLIELASKLEGIDLVDFEKSIREGRFDSELERNLKIARKAMKKNLRTPAVFINGNAMPGISFESISQQIETILDERGGV